MQALQDNFFYHSDSRFGADGGLEAERRLLVEEQKLCKTRARKFSLETRRRRKALEERRRQWDVREQRQRENILQQRRQRVQDATERFQRAHLPPSQRRRRSFRRNVPNIEEALSQIQSCYTRQSTVMSPNSYINRSCTPSPRPPTISKSSQHQALCAVEAYTKLLREQSRTSFRNSREPQTTQEKQQNQSPQDGQLSGCCSSESLSSKDSLENEDPNNHSTDHLQCSYSSVLLESERHPTQRKQSDLFPTSDLTLSAMLLVGDDLIQSQKQHKPEQKRQEGSEGPNNKVHISKASWGFTSEQTPKTETRPSLNNCSLFKFCEIISEEQEAALDSSRPKQEALLDLRQSRVHDDRPLKHPSATEILPPAKNGNSQGILFGAPPKPNSFLNDSNTDNSSQEGTLEQTGKDNHPLSSQKEPSASINNLNTFSNSETTKTGKPTLQHACLSNIRADPLKCFKCPEEDKQNLPLSVGTFRPVCGVRFIKGILKKQSKYMSGDAACFYGSGHLIFAKQVALAIRDSVELTRAKAKDVERNSAVKKKLRWFDEVHVVGNRDKEQMNAETSNHPRSKKNPEDHQPSLSVVSEGSKPGPSMTSGYHFTKQAWADVGVQVSLCQEWAGEVKVLQSATRTAGPKAPWRERPAGVGAGPVSSRTRKGTVMRPQSATEVTRIAKAQGRVIAPRPPPRMEPEEENTARVTRPPYGVSSQQAVAAERALHKDPVGGFSSPYARHLIRTDSATLYTPPSYACPVAEGNAKGRASSGHQEAQGCGRRRGTAFNEKGLCLDCTPTDEEISQLWHGVRSALATKDAQPTVSRETVESGRAVRKPCMEQSRQPPGSGNRRPPQPSKPRKQSTRPIRVFSNTYDVAFTDDGAESAAQLHLAEVYPAVRLEERNVVAAMEMAQTRGPATAQRHSQQQGLTALSLEEQRILLSLDRLNQQLHCVRDHAGSDAATRGLALIAAPTTKETKVTNHHKHRAASANSRPRYLKKF
ncbi:centrosomal protein of 126 kDa isoform X1 [Scophthalmus maximus]|uniref:centrosomal protein of 126 kDa isoform X1 n=1 Tax=Scophthalmus maximus TaxID=52904 RepID=UPI001FA8C158|nr:centrosomal protein of 126 kDa isoform X1 [Scophthalmus maximus]